MSETTTKVYSEDGRDWLRREWDKRISEPKFTPEPEVPEEIKDLLINSNSFRERTFDETIIEAYRRGQKAVKP